jgi:15-cis-phytoene synthase
LSDLGGPGRGLGATPGTARERVSRCQAILEQHGKSFALASRLLPARMREDAAAVYAFCRRADDAIDDAPVAALVGRELGRLESELASIYAGASQAEPVLAEFQRVVFSRTIPIEYPLELLRGLRMDVEGKRYTTFAELRLYCHRVAGSVGLMMCHVLGLRDPRALVPAAQLGIAMQLTNVCRDVLEDWRRERLYLPLELLGSAGSRLLPRGDFPPLDARATLGRAVQRLLADAERHYLAADRGIVDLGFRPALAVRVARLVYSAIGARIADRGHDVLAPRASVPRPLKLWLVMRAALSSLCELPLRIVRPWRAAPLTTTVRFSDVDDA